MTTKEHISKEAMNLIHEQLQKLWLLGDKAAELANPALDAMKALAEQPAHPVVPDAIHHTDLSESFEYIQGWNDCRAAMFEGKENT